jgi:ABC-2 type transport system permease protein
VRKVFVIAAREYQAAVRTKSFLVSLLVLPLMMGGSIIVQFLVKDQVDVREKRFAVVDRTPGEKLVGVLEEAVRKRNDKEIFDPETHKQNKPVFALERVAPSADTPEAIQQQRFDLSERVRKGELFGFLEIGADVTRPAGSAPPAGAAPFPLPGASSEANDRAVVRYQSNSPTYDAFQHWAQALLNDKIREARIATTHPDLTGPRLTALLQPVPLLSKGLSERVAATGRIAEGRDENPIVSILLPGGLLIMMFMMVLVGATPLMNGVVEEKMQRTAEVLLGSLRPFQLMMGKLIGMVAVSLTLAAIYLACGYAAARHYDVAQFLRPETLAWFLLFQGLAVCMYGSLFIAIGAACTDVRETQTMVWPVMLLACLPMFIWVNVVREPTSNFSLVASLFPFATPMLMIARQAVPPGIPLWQPLLGMVGVLATTTLCVYAAGRIFRVGILMQGKGANLGELARWVVRG